MLFLNMLVTSVWMTMPRVVNYDCSMFMRSITDWDRPDTKNGETLIVNFSDHVQVSWQRLSRPGLSVHPQIRPQRAAENCFKRRLKRPSRGRNSDWAIESCCFSGGKQLLLRLQPLEHDIGPFERAEWVREWWTERQKEKIRQREPSSI